MRKVRCLWSTARSAGIASLLQTCPTQHRRFWRSDLVPNFPYVPLAALVNAFPGLADEGWIAKVRSSLEAIDVVDFRGDTSAMKRPSSGMLDEARRMAEQRIPLLAGGLARLFQAEIPLLRVDPLFFRVQEVRNAAPPLGHFLNVSIVRAHHCPMPTMRTSS